MARAISASAERKPKAILVTKLEAGVHRFDPGVGEVMAEGGLDAGAVLGDGAGQLDEGRQPAAAGPHQPGVEEAQGSPGLAEVEDLTRRCCLQKGKRDRGAGWSSR